MTAVGGSAAKAAQFIVAIEKIRRVAPLNHILCGEQRQLSLLCILL